MSAMAFVKLFRCIGKQNIKLNLIFEPKHAVGVKIENRGIARSGFNPETSLHADFQGHKNKKRLKTGRMGTLS
jgi:hypothetical protein